jgi:hypothetical protein
MNFAIAEARARDHGSPNQLATQLFEFFDRSGGAASPDSLYVIEMGSNDVNDALRAVLALQDPNAILEAASTAIASGVASLYAAGARQFLVWNVPDLGLTPAASIFDQQFPGAAALVTLFTQQFNAKLDADLAVVSLLPGIQIRRVDAFETIRGVVDAPEQFGLTNVTVPCIMPGIPPFTCHRPDEYLFWTASIRPRPATLSWPRSRATSWASERWGAERSRAERIHSHAGTRDTEAWCGVAKGRGGIAKGAVARRATRAARGAEGAFREEHDSSQGSRLGQRADPA